MLNATTPRPPMPPNLLPRALTDGPRAGMEVHQGADGAPEAAVSRQEGDHGESAPGRQDEAETE
jgi:hypothetical protein